MPIHYGNDKDGCYAKWGEKGAKYHYTCGNEDSRKNAKKKVMAQAAAIGEFVGQKVSFDFDETLTKANIQQKAAELIKQGVRVYVISARHDKAGMYSITDKLGIPKQRVYATGSNKAKIEQIKALGITDHYDNNSSVINKLSGIGHLVSMSIHERFSDLIKFLRNDNE